MITGAAFVDLSAAYDTVNHRLLIRKLYDFTEDSPLCRVIQNMLSSRRFFVELNNYRSRWRNQKNGSEERLPRLTRRTLVQLRTYKSPFLKSYLHKVDAKTHPSPLCTICNIHTHDTHRLFNCTHIPTTLSPLDLWTDPAGVTALLVRWTEKLAGGPQAGTSDSPH